MPESRPGIRTTAPYSSKRKVESQSQTAGSVRLQKVLADAGIASRRASEQLIADGRVAVDGVVVTQQGMRVDPARARVAVDGERVPVSPQHAYLALNKPRGMLTTMADDRGRPCVGDLVRDRAERLFHAGRLDADSEGLLLLTNDGELANRLVHPSRGVPKTYLAEVPAPVARGVARQLRDGVELDDGLARAATFRVVDSAPGRAMVEVVVHEGRKHVVRRLLAAVGLPVRRLVRTQIGPLALGDLRPGRIRRLSNDEVSRLYSALDM